MNISLILSFLGGYLIGSIPWGLVLTRLGGLGDIRKIGSGNIGATNVLRTGHKSIALAVLLLDGLKGAAAVWAASYFIGRENFVFELYIYSGSLPALAAGLGAVLGHNFPLWLRFKGGKGVATTLGVITALSWPTGLVCALVWLVTALVLRYSSLAALVSLSLSPGVIYLFEGDRRMGYLAALLALMSWLRHRENIHRLRTGTEGKIKLKK